MTTGHGYVAYGQRYCKQLVVFLRATHGADYLAAKAVDFGTFTRFALLITAVFVASTVVWDYAIDPVNAWRAAGLRMAGCGAVLLWAIASRRHVQSPLARLAALLVPLIVEALFVEILSILTGGSSYGMGGFLYFFIFVPFLMLSQPFAFTVLVLALISVFPMLAALAGLSAGLDWVIYNAYVSMVFFPVVGILLLFEYLYWKVFSYRRQIEAQAVTDALTQIANRRHFLAEATRSLELHHRNDRTASLLFVDIDHFKRINDDHGHGIGDAVINHVVQTLIRLLRSSDLIARYGGEEFVVLLPETRSDTGSRIAERMCRAVARKQFQANGLPGIALSVSIGVTTYDPAADGMPDVDLLIREADRALYEAKRCGRDRVVSHGRENLLMPE